MTSLSATTMFKFLMEERKTARTYLDCKKTLENTWRRMWSRWRCKPKKIISLSFPSFWATKTWIKRTSDCSRKRLPICEPKKSKKICKRWERKRRSLKKYWWWAIAKIRSNSITSSLHLLTTTPVMKSAKSLALRIRTRYSTSSTRLFAWKTHSTKEKTPQQWWRTSKRGCFVTMNRQQNSANKFTHILSISSQPRKTTNSTMKFSCSSAICSKSRLASNRLSERRTNFTGSTTSEWTKSSTAAHQMAQKST